MEIWVKKKDFTRKRENRLIFLQFSRVIIQKKTRANKKREKLVWWKFPTGRSTDSAIGPPSKRARISEGSEIASSLNQMNQQNNVLDSIFSGSNDQSNQVQNVDELLVRITIFFLNLQFIGNLNFAKRGRAKRSQKRRAKVRVKIT